MVNKTIRAQAGTYTHLIHYALILLTIGPIYQIKPAYNVTHKGIFSVTETNDSHGLFKCLMHSHSTFRTVNIKGTGRTVHPLIRLSTVVVHKL